MPAHTPPAGSVQNMGISPSVRMRLEKEEAMEARMPAKKHEEHEKKESAAHKKLENMLSPKKHPEMASKNVKPKY